MGVKILAHMKVKIKKKNKKIFFIFSHSQNRTCDRIELIFFFVSFCEKYMNVYLFSYWHCDKIELMLIFLKIISKNFRTHYCYWLPFAIQ